MQLLFDGTNSNMATVAQGYAERIVQDVALARALAGRAPPLDLRERAWFNPDLASRNYNVPAVIGLLIMLWSASCSPRSPWCASARSARSSSSW